MAEYLMFERYVDDVIRMELRAYPGELVESGLTARREPTQWAIWWSDGAREGEDRFDSRREAARAFLHARLDRLASADQSMGDARP